MNIWKLFKGRLILCLATALVSGYSFVAWRYSVSHPDATLGHVLSVTMIRGPLATVFLFFLLAGIVLPKDARKSRGHADFDSFKEDRDWYVDSVLGLDSNLLTDKDIGITPCSSDNDV